MPYIILFAALYLMFIAWLFTAYTAVAFLWAKLLPFLLSIALGVYAIKSLGWLAFL